MRNTSDLAERGIDRSTARIWCFLALEKVFDTIEAEPELLRGQRASALFEPAAYRRLGHRRSFAKSMASAQLAPLVGHRASVRLLSRPMVPDAVQVMSENPYQRKKSDSALRA